MKSWKCSTIFLAYPGSALPDNLSGFQLSGTMAQMSWQIAEAAEKAAKLIFWDFRFGAPDFGVIEQLMEHTHVDIWHSGLRLGLQNCPGILDFVMPTNMLNCDADSSIESSSWRLSLRACIIDSRVFEELGGLKLQFRNLKAASLELGYRCIRHGVIMRHTPLLLPRTIEKEQVFFDFESELRFLCQSYSRKWCQWALFRSILSGYVNVIAAMTSARKVFVEPPPPNTASYSRTQIDLETITLDPKNYSVSILIPTLDRYTYLRNVLAQIREQTIAPIEILIIDQTDELQRDYTIKKEFSDLPLRIIYVEEKGQVSSRNIGLQLARGQYVLFLDDDDEIKPKLIEMHLKNLEYFAADTSSGSVDEVGALPLKGIFTRTRISNVFPTNNTLIKTNLLSKTGLFDMAYQRRQSEDGDLGTRMHLSGALMIYNPQISVYHHRAPQGGLREHNARVITYSSSRQRLLHRRFPHVSEVYLRKRYYSKRQNKEAIWLSILGTFNIRGGIARKLLKAMIAFILLPDSLIRLKRSMRKADELLKHYPQIPHYPAD